MKYRKKPVVVEAVCYTGANYKEIVDFTSGVAMPIFNNDEDQFGEVMYVRTLEGNMCVNVGDLVIKGVQGEFYPCKPDIFSETYERVTS